MSDQVLLKERRGPVICITLNRPHVLNALNVELRRELTRFWRDLRDDDELRVAIVTGAGTRAFSTGRDLKETATADDGGERLEYDRSGEYGYPGSATIGKPVIAAINGHCMAAGLMLTLGCDIRIASRNATFGNPQVARGRGTKVPYELIRAGVPRAVAMDMGFIGEPLTSEQALQWGLVSRVTEQDELLPLAWRLAETIAGNSPVVVSGLKRAAECGLLDLPANEALKLWEPVTRMMGNTQDAIEGAKSFAQGRKAAF